MGRLEEAESVLEGGLAVHPGLSRARLARAHLWADTGRALAALGSLDELYPRDPGNVRLVSLYLRLLVDAGRHAEARILLDRADIIGVPETERAAASARLGDAAAAGVAVAREEGRRPMAVEDGADAPEVAESPGARGVADAFGVPVVALRLERAGRLSPALDIWKRLAEECPDRPDIAGRVSDLQFRIEFGAETLHGELIAFGLPAPPPEAARPMLLRWRTALQEES